MIRFLITVPPALAIVAALGMAQPAPGATAWSYDEITLSNGAKFQGLILEELPSGVKFRTVSRPPGRPTITLTLTFARFEIASLQKLTEDDRALLKKRLAELDPTGEGERKRMEALELVTINEPGRRNGVRRYESEFFVLESGGTEELIRRSAVRLEQIYAAFDRFLPPTTQHPQPTRILLATDREEYRSLLGAIGDMNILNPAVYDQRANRIVCWSDLKRLGDELQTARLHHSQQLLSLKQYEEGITRLYKDQKELDRFLAPVHMESRRVWKAEYDNGKKFDRATERLFAILYHEAFHAYVGSFLYPPLSAADVKAGKGTGELPRWLNEGLAQVFETAVVEAGEIRADSPDSARLARVKDRLKRKGPDRLIPLAELLVTGSDAFLAFHEKAAAGRESSADRAYLTSWALAYYLIFEHRVLGTPGFRKYLIAVNAGSDPRRVFADLVGKDTAAFEKEWHEYLLRLKSDGTLGKG